MHLLSDEDWMVLLAAHKARINTLQCALRELLDCPDLNLDELDPSTRTAIERARRELDLNALIP